MTGSWKSVYKSGKYCRPILFGWDRFVNRFSVARALIARASQFVLKPEFKVGIIVMSKHDDEYPDRLFSLSEANRLIPTLEEHLTAVKRGKSVLIETKDEIKKASKNAQFGGGSFVAPHYILALEQINDHLREIQEMGVLVKDVEMGLCDFPHLYKGRVVYLCWKLGESKVGWWHEVHSGYAGRQPLDSDHC